MKLGCSSCIERMHICVLFLSGSVAYIPFCRIFSGGFLKATVKQEFYSTEWLHLGYHDDQQEFRHINMVIDPKVLVGTDDDDGLGVGKISFGESFSRVGESIFFSRKNWRKLFFTIRLSICLPPCRDHSHLHMFVSSSLAKTIVSCLSSFARVIVSYISCSFLLCQNKSFPAAADWRLILAYFGESMAKVQRMHG